MNRLNPVIYFLLLIFVVFNSAWVMASENPDGLELQLVSLGGTQVEVRVLHKGTAAKHLLNLFDVPFHMLAFKITNEKGEKVNFRGALTKLPFQIENLIYLQPGGFFGTQLDLMALKIPAAGDNKASIGNYELTQGENKIKAIYDMRGMKNQFEGVQLWDGRLVSEEITIKLEKAEETLPTVQKSNAIKTQ